MADVIERSLIFTVYWLIDSLTLKANRQTQSERSKTSLAIAFGIDGHRSSLSSRQIAKKKQNKKSPPFQLGVIKIQLRLVEMRVRETLLQLRTLPARRSHNICPGRVAIAQSVTRRVRVRGVRGHFAARYLVKSG